MCRILWDRIHKFRRFLMLSLWDFMLYMFIKWCKFLHSVQVWLNKPVFIRPKWNLLLKLPFNYISFRKFSMPWLCESLLNMQLIILLQFMSVNLAPKIFVWNSMCISMFKWISSIRVNLCSLFFNLQRMFWISFKLYCLPWVKFPLQWSLLAILPFKYPSKWAIMFKLWFHLLSLCWLDHKLYALC